MSVKTAEPAPVPCGKLGTEAAKRLRDIGLFGGLTDEVLAHFGGGIVQKRDQPFGPQVRRGSQDTQRPPARIHIRGAGQLQQRRDHVLSHLNQWGDCGFGTSLISAGQIVQQAF